MSTLKEGLTGNLHKNNLPTYLLYNWQGKCKWAYLEGVFLVDPGFEAEFKEEHGAK